VYAAHDSFTLIMSGQSGESGSSRLGEKLLLFVGASLIVVSLLSLAIFVALSAFSLVTWSIPHFWSACFLLCSVSLSSWMLLYTGQLRIGGGFFLLRSNVLLLFSLIFAVFSSAIVRFPGYHKYFAVVILALALTVFHIAGGGILSPRILFRFLRNKLPTKEGFKS
jgi:hypothetical protein